MDTNFPIALTFDVDWAPDFVVAECVDLLAQFSVPASFFATHHSPLLKSFAQEPLFEVGIHPNFYAGSSHGSDERNIIKFLLDIVPDAKTMRTHGLYQSSNLFFSILRDFPQIKFDFSLFLPNNPFCVPFKFHDEFENNIIRVSYQWEDDFFFLKKPADKIIKKIVFREANYQIFDFHPIHVYLNSYDSASYNALKSSLKKSLLHSSKLDMDNFRNKKIGTRNWLISILESVETHRFVHASQITDKIGMDLA